MFAGWVGVLLFFLAGVPDGSYQLLDVNISIAITNYLKSSPILASILFKFTSIDESYVNVPILLLIIGIASYQLKANRKIGAYVMVCSLFWVELWILGVVNPFFSKVSVMNFNIVPEVGDWMSQTQRVYADNNSIISRHVFAMFFYASYCYNKNYTKLAKLSIWLCALLFAIPPILNAKHWLSDWLFSVWFAYSAVNLSKFVNLETKLHNFFQNK